MSDAPRGTCGCPPRPPPPCSGDQVLEDSSCAWSPPPVPWFSWCWAEFGCCHTILQSSWLVPSIPLPYCLQYIHNGGIVKELLQVAFPWAVAEVRCVEDEQKQWKNSSLGCACVAFPHVWQAVLQLHILQPVREVVCNTCHKVQIDLHDWQLLRQLDWLDHVESTRKVKERDHHLAVMMASSTLMSV